MKLPYFYLGLSRKSKTLVVLAVAQDDDFMTTARTRAVEADVHPDSVTVIQMQVAPQFKDEMLVWLANNGVVGVDAQEAVVAFAKSCREELFAKVNP